MKFKRIGKLVIIIVVSLIAVLGSYGLGHSNGWDDCIKAIQKIQKIQVEIKEKQWENLKDKMKGRKRKIAKDVSMRIC